MSFKIPCGGFRLDEESFSLDENGVLSIPKPLTYDYMPEGYPSKSVETVTVMEEQELEFVSKGGRAYVTMLTTPPELAEGETYTVNWDGAEYKCVCVAISSRPVIGNLSIMGNGDDTGEPFVCIPDEHLIATLDTSASHTVGITTIAETVTPMAKEFLPAGSSGSGQFIVTVYATNSQGTEFAADKTYDEIKAAIDSGAMVLVHYKISETSPNYDVYYNITVKNGIYSFLCVEPMEGGYVYFYVIRIGEENGEMVILKKTYKAQLANQT